MAKTQKETNVSLIEVAIKRSIEIILIQAAKQSLKETRFFINRLSEPFYKKNCEVQIEIELNEKLKDNKLRISKLLEPIFKAQGLEIPSVFWFSSRNLKDGYVLVYKGVLDTMPTHVLLLNTAFNYKDDNNFKRWYPGELVPIDEIADFLNTVEGVIKETSPLKITYSINKIRQNEK